MAVALKLTPQAKVIIQLILTKITNRILKLKLPLYMKDPIFLGS